MALPPELLNAIAAEHGGRVVLVLGAGCSAEPPTSLLMAHEYAEEAHRKLMADRILEAGDCPDPSDLSAVADAVRAKKGGQQFELVRRLPRARFRSAQPNAGCLLAAAMLREGAVNCVMSLNFDLAMSNALTALGNVGDVAVIRGPEDHEQTGLRSLIYLHRNVEADPEDWILCSAALDESWKDEWEEAITRKILSAPITVFAGLGTPAGVLVDSSVRISKMLQGKVAIYQVGPRSRDDSEFFAKLGLANDAYLQMGWGQFMQQLADRLMVEYQHELEKACRELLTREGWEGEAEDVGGLCTRITQLGLIRLGGLRARWVLHDSSYLPRAAAQEDLLADLILAVGLIERATDSRGIFGEDGIVEFRQGDRHRASVVLAHGRGTVRWLVMETVILRGRHHWDLRDPLPRYALVAGVPGSRQEVAVPENVVEEEKAHDLVRVDNTVKLIDVDELRSSPELAKEILN